MCKLRGHLAQDIQFMLSNHLMIKNIHHKTQSYTTAHARGALEQAPLA